MTTKQKIGHLVGCVTVGAQVVVFAVGVLQQHAGVLHWLPNMNDWNIIVGSIYFAGAGSIYGGVTASPSWLIATAAEVLLRLSAFV